MKRLFVFLSALAVLVLAASVASAGEYVVQKGDTLAVFKQATETRAISYLLDFKENTWLGRVTTDTEVLPEGRRITFVSAQDVFDAQLRLVEMGLQQGKDFYEPMDNMVFRLGEPRTTRKTAEKVWYRIPQPELLRYATEWRVGHPPRPAVSAVAEDAAPSSDAPTSRDSTSSGERTAKATPEKDAKAPE